MSTNNSIFYILPAEHRAAGNKLWQLLGLGPNNYNVAFSPTVHGEKTHWGGNYENMPAHEEAAVRALKTALPPLGDDDEWGENGMPTIEEAEAATTAMCFFVREDPAMTAVEHQTAILAAKGLVVWQEEPEPEEG